MSTTHDLKTFLRQEYNRTEWQSQLRRLLGPERVEYFDQPQLVLNPDTERVQAVRQLGYADVGEVTLFGTSQRLAVLEVELRPATTAIGLNRIGLRALTYPFIDDVSTHGLLVFYFDPSQPDYRLSFQTRGAVTARAGSPGATERRRYTFVLGPREAATTAAQRLTDLGLKAGRITLADLREAFSVERLSKDFFGEYKKLYEEFTRHLGQHYRALFVPLLPPEASKALRLAAQEKMMRDYAKRLLGRIVFLHFLQKKGWMGCAAADPGAGSSAPWQGGHPDFLRILFGKFAPARPGRFHSVCLTELFFKNLNKFRKGDILKIKGITWNCRVPYLNGGLFEDNEPKGEQIDFPDALFGRLLEFFGRYNFTIEENRPDDHDVGIDPEMLGHIFENLLEENRARGSIYTPRAIVQHMAQESLVAYLTRQLASTPAAGGRPALARFVRSPYEGLPTSLRPYAADLDRHLREVTICDPAIGSGAFPIGLLQELFTVRLCLYPYLPKEKLPTFDPVKIKNHIVHRNIYGVDADEGAVGIARLRFWLALVVDASTPVRLPNLDYKVMQGDSLLESFKGYSLETVADGMLDFQQADRRKFKQLQEELFGLGSLVDNEESLEKRKQEIRAELDQLVRKYFGTRLLAEKKKASLEVQNITYELAHSPFPADTEPQARQVSKRKKREELEKELTKAQAQVQKVQNDFDDLLKLEGPTPTEIANGQPRLVPAHPYFLWHLNFPEVFEHEDPARRGFDIVITNPPYMRVQTSQTSLNDQKSAYENAYSAVAKGAYDLANLFVYLAVERLINQRGTACFIFPHKFFNAAGAEAFRTWLTQGRYLHRLVHFGANRVFNAADTYVAVALLDRQPHPQFELLKVPYGTDPARYDELLAQDKRYQPVSYAQLETATAHYGSGNTWLLLDTVAEYELLAKLYADKRTLQSVVDIFVGLQTSADKLYVLKLSDEQPADEKLLWGHNELEPERRWEVERDYWKPMLRGRDVKRFAPLDTDTVVFFPYRKPLGQSIVEVLTLKDIQQNYPRTLAYLKQYEREFKERESSKAADWEFWYRYLRENNIGELLDERPRLSSMEICTSHPNVAYNDGRFYHATTVYSWVKKPGAAESYDYLLALANSRVLWWFLKHTGDTLQGDARRLKSNYLNPFPLPPAPAPAATAAVEALVRCLRWLQDRENALTPAVLGLGNGPVAAYLQQVLDLAVCELYPALADRMQAREVNILALLPPDLAPVLAPGSLKPAAIGAVYAAWQQPASAVRNRQLLATTRLPEWLGPIFGA